MIETLEKIGGWPVVKGDNWRGGLFHWIEANEKIFQEGMDDKLILDIRITVDQKNSLKRIISVNLNAFFLFSKTRIELNSNLNSTQALLSHFLLD